MISIRIGCTRLPVAPLLALGALGVSAIVATAGSSVCTHPVAMPAMAGMPGDPGLPVCPIVLALLVVSSALAAWALVALHRDPQRVLSISVLLRSLATLPVGRTFIALAGVGGTVTAAMVAVDDGLPAPGFCALLAFAVAALALLAVLAAVLVARFTRALWRGVIALCAVRTMRLRNLPAKIRYEAVVLRAIAVSRAWRGGLRAPPLGLH